MLASELLDEIYAAYRGKTVDRTPAWSEAKAVRAITIANRKIREWATDPNNRWASLFSVNDVGTIDTATFTYDLDDTFFMPSDYALVTKTDDTNVQYPIVPPQRRDQYSQALYISGFDPKTITFAQTIDAGLDGGTLKMPGYYIPDPLSAEGSFVPVDIPEWLVYVTASELARNDAAKEDQVANLVGQANDLYRKMIDNNNGGAFLQGLTIVNNMPNVGSSSDYDWLD